MVVPWTDCVVGDFVESGEAAIKTGPFGTQLHARDYVNDGTPVINARNIGFGTMRPEKLEFIGQETVARLADHLVRSGDIVFGRKGAVDRHVLIRAKHDGWFQGSDCLRLRFNSKNVEPRYISYALLTYEHQRWMLNQCSHGATMASLNQDIIRRVPLRLPPVPTQRAIVKVLSSYDDLIENNTRRIAVLDEMARSLYREWFVHFRFPGHEKVKVVASPLGPVPEGWKVSRVGEVAATVRGRSYRGTELVDGGGYPFVNLKCIERDGGFRPDGLKRYAGEFKASQTVRRGDTVMGVTDMTQERRLVARAARIPMLGHDDLAVFSMDLVKIVAREGVHPEYLYGMLRFSSFPDEVKQHANGVNVLHLNPSRIEGFVFPLPPRESQQHYADFARPVFAEGDVLQEKTKNLQTTRDLLLPKLISGEIEIPSVEPLEATA